MITRYNFSYLLYAHYFSLKTISCQCVMFYFTVEFILGMNGSTMGCLISFIFPAVMFLKVMDSKSTGKWQAKVGYLVLTSA